MTAKKTTRKDPATIQVQNGPRDDLKEGIVQLSRRLDAIVQRKFGRWSERLHGESAIELPAKVDNADEWKKRAKSVRSDERNGQQRSIQLIVFVRGWRSEILKPARAALSALSDDTSYVIGRKLRHKLNHKAWEVGSDRARVATTEPTTRMVAL